MDDAIEWFVILVCIVIVAFAGHYSGDQATFKSCAIKGSAELHGSGTIKCEVVKGESK